MMFPIKHSFGDNIKIEWSYEEEAPDVCSGDAEADARDLASFESGALSNIWVKISIWDKSGHVKGTASIGQVWVDSTDDETILSSIDPEDLIYEATNSLTIMIKEIMEANDVK